MLRENTKMAWRYLLKDRSFTLLNLLGLSTALACTILIYLWVDDELHVDKFNTSDSRLFQVLKNAPSPAGITTDERTPGLLASTLAKEFPEVEYACPVVPVSWSDKKGTLTAGDQQLRASASFAGEDYFSMFSYRLIQGSPAEVLKDKMSIVISSHLALKLFHTTENVIGKEVGWNQQGYTGLYRISGIFERPPANATAQFDVVLNYALFLEKQPKLNDWRNNDPSTYVLLKKGANINSFNEKIAGMVKSRVERSGITLWAQQYSHRYLYNHYENGVPAGGRITYVRIFSIIAVFILIIACINFMNLSTARAAGRIKETGIKKAIGAPRRTLIFQYMTESFILSFLSLGIALGLVALALPTFTQIAGRQLTLSFSAGFVLAAMGIVLITSLLSGSYPALYLSRFRPAVILRSRLKTSVSELLVRKGLVVFQFTLSAIFIVSVLVIYRQTHLVQTKHLGYDREHVLYFERGGTTSDKYEQDLQQFLVRVKNIPGVVNAANFRHNITSREGGTHDISWPGKEPNINIDFTDLDVGYDFIETAGITLKEGRAYARNYGNEKMNVVFNETAIRTMGLKDPIGKTVHLWGNDRTIIGVVKDFNFQSLHDNIKPCFFELSVNQWASKIMVRVQGGREGETIDALTALYKEYNRGETMEYRWLDEDYQALYAAESRVSSLSKYFAGIAVIISCLGLLGLAAFTAQRRQRELGIRKVVGASVNSIVLLLSRDFLLLIGIALLVAFPLSWWMMDRWLSAYAYRVQLGIDVFIWSGIFVVLMAFLSIGFQSVRAALENPVKSLRAE